MSANRIIVSILTATILCAAHGVGANAGSEAGGPALGKWEFSGKDNAGVAWTGVLTIGKLDPERFDANKYHAMCSLDLQSASSGRGVEAPCRYDPGTRAVSFSTGVSTTSSYTAVLSADGKSLTQGQWRESKKDGQNTTVVKSGEWSAKLTAQ